MNINIEISLDVCKNHNITPSQYYILYLVHNKLFEEVKTLRNTYKKDLYFKEDILNLVHSGFLKHKGNDIKKLKISECSTQNIFKEEAPEESPWVTFINSYRDLFPTGVLSGNNYVRSSYKDCDYKMKQFIKNYPKYKDEDLILKATEAYIQRCRVTNFKYMKTAANFIIKDKSSVLASECEAVLGGGTKVSSIGFSSGV
jgi:hypothetical protein